MCVCECCADICLYFAFSYYYFFFLLFIRQVCTFAQATLAYKVSLLKPPNCNVAIFGIWLRADWTHSQLSQCVYSWGGKEVQVKVVEVVVCILRFLATDDTVDREREKRIPLMMQAKNTLGKKAADARNQHMFFFLSFFLFFFFSCLFLPLLLLQHTYTSQVVIQNSRRRQEM